MTVIRLVLLRWPGGPKNKQKAQRKHLVYFWGFCPFQIFIVPIHRAITKNISESICGKSRYLRALGKLSFWISVSNQANVILSCLNLLNSVSVFSSPLLSFHNIAGSVWMRQELVFLFEFSFPSRAVFYVIELLSVNWDAKLLLRHS